MPEAEAEAARLRAAIALRTNDPDDWAKCPNAVQESDAVRRYVKRNLIADERDVLTVYESHIRPVLETDWATGSLAHLRELASFVKKPICEVTRQDADAFLTYVLTSPGPHKKKGQRSRATRNRKLAACSRFFRWAVRTGRTSSNPFKGIPQISEGTPDDIIYCTSVERDAIVAAAENDREGVAVWIAFFAGLRRSEIHRLNWEDVTFGKRDTITVRHQTKTGKRRVVPLNRRLRARLEATPETKRRGRIVPWPNDDRAWRSSARCLLSRLHTQLRGVPSELIGFNAWRHTFASIAIQQGVPIDIVAAWLGNSPDVCRRHYANVIPKDRHDEFIDLL